MLLLDVVHAGNSIVGITVLSVTDEAEATATASVAVPDNDLLVHACQRWLLRKHQIVIAPLRQPGRIPQTLHAKRHRQCAMQAHCGD